LLHAGEDTSVLNEVHEKVGKKGKPTKKEEEELLRELKDIRREIWKRYQKEIRRKSTLSPRNDSVMKCAVEGCKDQVSYIWDDAYLPGERAVLSRGDLFCYPLCETHDSMLHETIDKMRAQPAELMRKRIRIGR